MPRHWIGPALLGGLCLLALVGCKEGPETEYVTVTPERGAVESLVEDTGSVAYREHYAVIPTVSGKVLSCFIEEGDGVTAGQTLYLIDAAGLEDQITQARLSLKSAQETQEQALAACEDLTVTAAASGVVTKLYCHVGDFVSTGSPIADVEDSANLLLTVPFAKTAAASMGPGSPAIITFPAYSDTLAGTVKRVYDAPTAFAEGREGVYVEIAFTNPGAVVRGTLATASVGTAACMEAGSVDYATAQTLYATQSGQVLTLPLEVGQAVTQGDTVLTLENSALTNAAANAALAVESASVQLGLLERKRPDYTVTAPVDGTVITRSAKVGDYAAAATPLATLVESQALCVQVEVDEIYIERVWPGQAARVSFTTDSGEERTYTGTVRRVDDTGITAGGVTDYTVELELADMEGLKAGMNVAVAIVTQGKSDCLRLPVAAVDRGTVQVLREGKAVEVPVTTGLSGGGWVEITGGIGPEDAVILPG